MKKTTAVASRRFNALGSSGPAPAPEGIHPRPDIRCRSARLAFARAAAKGACVGAAIGPLAILLGGCGLALELDQYHAVDSPPNGCSDETCAASGGTGGYAGATLGGPGGTAAASPNAVCGNNMVEGQEPCDQGDLGGKTCQTQGFASGGLQCTPDCKLDATHCSTCGDGVVDPGEECDGVDLGGLSNCADVHAGNASELLSCDDDCRINLGNCSGCGDGAISPPEDCEPASGTSKPDLGGATCKTLGWDGGNLDCDRSCRFVESECHACGDAQRNGIEECDGADFGGKSCQDYDTVTGEPFASGLLRCSTGCKIDTSRCKRCGDGVVTSNETCDTSALQGQTCAILGFTDGTLACAAGCNGYDTTKCTRCGDGVVRGNEQCDGSNLAGASCMTLGFAGGSLSCSGSCKFNTNGCTNNTCGDGIINGSDACDCGGEGAVCSAQQLDGRTCHDFPSPTGTPFEGGTLGCLSPLNCAFDVSGCYYCGDGVLNPNEQCDGNALDGQTCTSLGFSSGNLRCNPACQVDTSECKTVGNPLILCNTPRLDVPDNDPNGITNKITVFESGQVVDVNVALRVPHPWVSDVVIKLSHNGTTSTLIHRPGIPATDEGCTRSGIDVRLDDEASTPVENVCVKPGPAIQGTCSPNEMLSRFSGMSMSGDWILRVADVEEILTGTLREWCIEVNWQ